MDIDNPIVKEKDCDILAQSNETGSGGFFPVGANNMWHGGAHLHAQKPVVAIRDGILVAYRIDKEPAVVTLDGKKLEYSSSFVLLRHETATPLGQKIEFWSLYMHLLPYTGYRDDPTIETPIFLRAKRPEKVKTNRDGKGLHLAGDASAAFSVGIVPMHGKISLTDQVAPTGHWAKGLSSVFKVKWQNLEGWLKIDKRTIPDSACTRFLSTAIVKVMAADDPAKIAGEISPNKFFEVGTQKPTAVAWQKYSKRHRVKQVTFGAIQGFALLDGVALPSEWRINVSVDDPGAAKLGVAIHQEANASSPVIGIIAKGTAVRFKDPLAVRFKATTTYHEILDGGFIPVDKTILEDDWSIGQPDAFDAVVKPKKPVHISRGDVIGWAGPYLREPKTSNPTVGVDNLIHFEVFADNVSFFTNTNNEQWFCDILYRLAAASKLKQCEPLPAAQNPTIAVALGVGAMVRLSECYPHSNHAKAFRHEVHGWKRTSELGHFRTTGYNVLKPVAPTYTNYPTCWCAETNLTAVALGASPGDYLIYESKTSVPETFKLVRYKKPGAGRPKTIDGWAREHYLGDYYPQAYRPSEAVHCALAAKPASLNAALNSPTASRIVLAANTWVRSDSEDAVTQTFHKVTFGALTVNALHEFKIPVLSDCRYDRAGHLWGETTTPAGKGWVDITLDTISRKFAHAGLSAISFYDWAKWKKFEEAASTKAGEEFFSQDGFCDIAPLIESVEKDTSGKARAGSKADKALSDSEMKTALSDANFRDQMRAAACLHPSEWDATDMKKWERLKKPPWNMPSAEFANHKALIQKLQLFKDAFAGTTPAPASATVWHLHPLGFIKQLRGMKGVTVDQIKRIMPHAKLANINKFIGHLNAAMERYQINTPLQQAHFLAQLAHESEQLKATEEHASGDDYEWRFNLHNIRPGDGRKFKGRGLIQLTGRLNYSIYGAYIGVDLTTNPAQLATDPMLACDVSAWFWRRGPNGDLGRLATKADAPTVTLITKRINGGYNGLKQRKEFFFNAVRVLID
ncbi:MAG: hypothetical protein JW841_09860 [Deltaproteobacteria bacterium]|nr:hypothetical protein [Deltaproteobacteria bacterium]